MLMNDVVVEVEDKEQEEYDEEHEEYDEEQEDSCIAYDYEIDRDIEGNVIDPNREFPC